MYTCTALPIPCSHLGRRAYTALGRLGTIKRGRLYRFRVSVNRHDTHARAHVQKTSIIIKIIMHFSHTPRKLLPHMAMPMRWRDGRQTSGRAGVGAGAKVRVRVRACRVRASRHGTQRPSLAAGLGVQLGSKVQLGRAGSPVDGTHRTS